MGVCSVVFFFSSRRRHTRLRRDWSSDVCSSDLGGTNPSLLEAMASNSLICARDNIFNKSILEKDAYYFKTSEQISGLIDTESKAIENKFVLTNHEKIKNLYSWNKIVDDYNSFFLHIMNR